MKRVSVNSLQSQPPVDEEARVNLRHQSLLQDYLELQKEFVSEKKKVQITMQKRETLLAEVRFLRRRHKYLLKKQTPKIETDGVHRHHNSDVRLKLSAKQRKHNIIEGVQNKPSRVLDMKRIRSHLENEEGVKQNHVREPVRVQKKPKNCLINDKKAGKKKISVQDQVALKVVSFVT